MTLKFAATGLGLVGSDAEVALMARSGDRAEILRGPLLYGIVFVVATLFGFRNITAAYALMCLCFGDGLADVIGRRYGHQKLPWSKKKSVAGTLAFILSSFFACLVIRRFFAHMGWSTKATWVGDAHPLLIASLVAGLVESMPFADIDNVLAPAAFALVLQGL